MAGFFGRNLEQKAAALARERMKPRPVKVAAVEPPVPPPDPDTLRPRRFFTPDEKAALLGAQTVADHRVDLCDCLECFMARQSARVAKQLSKVTRLDEQRAGRRKSALEEVRESMHRGWIGTTALPTLDYYDGRRES
jgi:hypothetical protein